MIIILKLKFILKKSKSMNLDYVSFFANPQNIEKLNIELQRFNTIYQYMKLNGISLPKN